VTVACWRALDEIAAGGSGAPTRITAAVNTARRQAWAGIAVADRTPEDVTGVAVDATVVARNSEKQGAEFNFKGVRLGLVLHTPSG
jgi:hypothetical protein